MDIDSLNNISYVEANKMILGLIDSSTSISNENLIKILNLKERELVSTFLEEFENFSEEQFLSLEKYINDNLNLEDKDFVSDLIDFASDWSLNINYKKILSFLDIDNDKNHFIVLSSVNYITENIKLFYVKEIVAKMRNILDNSNYYQNTQISAALCLFRITHNKKYLLEIKGWFDIDENKEFLSNKLKKEYYKTMYFPDIESILI